MLQNSEVWLRTSNSNQRPWTELFPSFLWCCSGLNLRLGCAYWCRFIGSRIDYCNSLLGGLRLSPLQSVLNVAPDWKYASHAHTLIYPLSNTLLFHVWTTTLVSSLCMYFTQNPHSGLQGIAGSCTNISSWYNNRLSANLFHLLCSSYWLDLPAPRHYDYVPVFCLNWNALSPVTYSQIPAGNPSSSFFVFPKTYFFSLDLEHWECLYKCLNAT